jgi:fumarate reductase flavoprotein subunit
VTTKSGRIESVKVLTQRESRPRTALREIPKRIVAAQQVRVDKVTGASVSSRAVMQAAAAALAKARE